jgi:hypothetical protein
MVGVLSMGGAKKTAVAEFKLVVRKFSTRTRDCVAPTRDGRTISSWEDVGILVGLLTENPLMPTVTITLPIRHAKPFNTKLSYQVSTKHRAPSTEHRTTKHRAPKHRTRVTSASHDLHVTGLGHRTGAMSTMPQSHFPPCLIPFDPLSSCHCYATFLPSPLSVRSSTVCRRSI